MGFRILRPLFPLGDVYLSAAAAALALDPAEIDRLLNRHHCGDWGDLGEVDKRSNDLDMREGVKALEPIRHRSGFVLRDHRVGSVDDDVDVAGGVLKVHAAYHAVRGRVLIWLFLGVGRAFQSTSRGKWEGRFLNPSAPFPPKARGRRGFDFVLKPRSVNRAFVTGFLHSIPGSRLRQCWIVEKRECR